MASSTRPVGGGALGGAGGASGAARTAATCAVADSPTGVQATITVNHGSRASL